MLACSQHTAHLLQKSNHFGPKQSKSRQADLRWGLTWARLSQQSIRFKWFNHEYNFLQAQQLLQPGSWSLQIVPRMPQDAHGRNIQSLWPSAPNRALLQDHCITRSLPRVFIDLFTIPPDRGVEDTFPPNIATSRGLCFFWGLVSMYFLREERQNTFWGSATTMSPSTFGDLEGSQKY